jgi:hypothetical protein
MWRGIIMEITMYYVTGNNRKWFNFKKNVSAYADGPVKNNGSFKNSVGERKTETRKTQMSSRNGTHF